MMYANSFLITTQLVQLHLNNVRYERTSFERNCD
jgi:hypothetical protein